MTSRRKPAPEAVSAAQALQDAANASLLRPSLDSVLTELQTAAADATAVRLAEKYADAIDQAYFEGSEEHRKVLALLGPKLLDVLKALGATPTTRTLKGGVQGGKLSDFLADRAK